MQATRTNLKKQSHIHAKIVKTALGAQHIARAWTFTTALESYLPTLFSNIVYQKTFLNETEARSVKQRKLIEESATTKNRKGSPLFVFVA